jgi:hypothetical protein
MSKARDKANIPSLNFSSTGIDDNATSTAITINSSQHVELHGGQIESNNNTSSITYSGGDNSNAGANLTLFGGSHATTPNVARFRSSATEVMRITSAGNVGIGTTAPDAKLSVNGVASFGDGTALLPSIANFGDLNTGMWFPAEDTIAFSEGGVEAMRIDSNGQLNTGKVVVRKDGASEIGQLVILNQSPDSNADLHFKGYAYRDRARIRAVDNASSTTGGSMKIETAGGTSTDGSSLETRMLLDKNGNISFYEDTGTTATMVWNATTERLGIGTGNPQNKLDISAATWDDGILIKNTGNFNVGIIGDANRTVAGGGLLNLQGRWNGTEVASVLFQAGSDTTNKDDGVLVFRTSSANNISERMRIDSSGFVGIGLTNPSTPLQVNGTVRASYFNTLNTQVAMSNNSADWDISSVIGTIPNVEGSISFELTMRERNQASVQLFRIYYIRVGPGTTFNISSAVWSVGSTAATTTISYPSAGTIRFTNSSFSVLDAQIRRISS